MRALLLGRLRPVAPVALLLVAGLLTGTAALALHTRWWGLALTALATGAALAALPPGWRWRPAYVVGWEVPVLLVGLRTGPGGDVVVTSDVPGYALLVLALLVGLSALLTLPARRPPRPDESASVGSSA